ncbi:TonB-dependent receptor [Chryseolinea lacunae]|uniref:TonB-dependent receptor n=1 Tax=Chryseolinea lacunae TaxID=2801331 RepID=A0ABS1L0W4_9BACT|nr:TonB-dependent receptor [Chryseolinea lacunae]MBL0745163.1 TonB-dependent receptor [Chryseolinea lacunae]
MNKLYRLLLCCFFLMSLGIAAQAQRRALINGEFKATSFKDFVDAVEAQTDYHFYYNPKTTDSLKVTYSAQNQNINVVLGQALAGTQLHFAVDEQGNIFVTEGRDIMSDLPVDFFDTGVAPSNNTLVSGFDYTAYEKREKQKKLAESKLYAIGPKSSNLQGNATMAGHVRDITNGEPLVGATVYIDKPLVGVITDQFGYYSISLPKGRHELKIKSIGMKSTVRQIMLYADGKLEIELDQDVTPLKEVVVESDKDVRVMGMQMGMEKLDIKTMKNMPLALGETDIMKVVLSLPGVQTVGEGTVGLNVRGGATNQNLILFNDAVVYNPSHLFGFFSTFNPDVLKNVELYKSGITADYGGRLSSVLDVTSREGNLKKFSGSGGISPITGRLTLEGPLIKEKTSFLLGARSTYSDWILRQLNTERLKNSTASFYDVNLNISHKINDKNNLYLSGYISHDKFKLNTDTSYAYSDKNASIKWKHIFNNKLYGVLTGGFSRYGYTMTSDLNPVQAFDMDFYVQQLNAKMDFSYFLNAKHTINAGLSVVRYNLAPGNIQPKGDSSVQKTIRLQHEQGQENAVYIGDNFEVSPKLSIYGGVRYSFYQYLGPRDVYQYANGVPRSEANITDSVRYGGGKSIASFSGAEPRFSIRYSLSQNASVKVSYNRMRQYIQMLSNTTAITPTDIWKLSDPYIRPQVGDQISLGFYKNTRKHSLEISLEAYYKTTKNALDFKGGAVLLLNKHIETDVVDSRGKAYGVEFMLKRSTGKLNGWFSYTYSRSFLQTVSPYAAEAVNKGDYYPSNYDKPHAVNFVGNYKFSRRFNFSLNMTYSTGRPITLPLAKYELGGSYRLYYSDRNQFRIPDYFRTDISINIEGNHKIRKLAHSSWTFAIYNLTGRANAYSVFFRSEQGKVQGYKLSIFAQPIPTVTYNFKF